MSGQATHTLRVDAIAFVEQHLPPRPARVLEIGCGRGELARTLADHGFDVVAIDPAAPEGAIYRRVSLAEFIDPESFDAIVAIRSLHHIPDLDGAVATMAELLRPGGRLMVHEHAWERLDDRTARWYLERRRVQGPGAPATLARCVYEWNEDHQHLHTAASMLDALCRRFTCLHLTWTPYLHGELAPLVTADQEQSLIDAGTINSTGFAFVGECRLAIHGAP
jgi:SAM-dependent methyltransferase